MTAPSSAVSPRAPHAEGPARAPRVAGIDVSLTGTAVATLGGTVRIPTTGRRADPLTARHARLVGIARRVLTEVGTVDLAVIEGPAHRAGHMSGHHDGSGLWWLIVDGLLDRDIPVSVMPPACRAKYATGNGAARKAHVMDAVRRRYGAAVATDDEADALALRAAGLDWLGYPLATVPDSHRTALLGAAWPEFTREVTR